MDHRDHTEAICAAVFLSGKQWGTLDGVLALTALKGSKLLLLTIGPDSQVQHVAVPPELDDTHPRPAPGRSPWPGRRALRHHGQRR